MSDAQPHDAPPPPPARGNRVWSHISGRWIGGHAAPPAQALKEDEA